MALPDSYNLLKEIEKRRKSRLICYITSNRQPGNLFATKIALDALELFYQHLKAIGKAKIITLFLNSNGGNLDTPWPLVNTIREFCEEFEVIVPCDARSAATLIALGADRIVMTPVSHLSPVDPEGVYERGGKQLKIQVEDVLGYLDFAKEKVGINEQESLIESLKLLAQEIQPTVLGSVNRTLSLIRRLSENLLKLHLKKIEDQEQINQIVDHLTHKLFSHQHLIGRKEAKYLVGFKDIVEAADNKIWNLSDELLKAYFRFMEEKAEFNPVNLLGDNSEISYQANRAIIESTDFCHVFEGTYNIKKDLSNQISITATSQKWKKYKRQNTGE